MGKSILIIDDDREDQDLIKVALEKAGFNQIHCSISGEEGLKDAWETRPDLIIVDTRLTGMSGFEVCQKIKAEKEISAKVIIITGAVDAVDAVKAREMGADDYCAKTSDYAPLVETVEKWLN